jgi:iron(III) transport system ATP-binding protein
VTRSPAGLRGRAASVEFRRVTKAYGEVVAVRDVSFAVRAGTLVTLLGPSGCGKTTLLRLIAGLESATAGQILIGEADVTRLAATERDVSMVFQSYALFPHMTVLENVCYGLRVGGATKGQAAATARDGLALLGLQGFDDRLPSELSGGQQQRVAVARALVLEPRVLLFDEPLSNLDAKLRRRVREEIRELQQRLGLTVVYVTHDQEEALAVSDRIIVMDRAVIAQEGTPRELYDEPASRFVADFIGDANLSPHGAGHDGAARIRLGDARLLGVRQASRIPLVVVRTNAIALSDAPVAGCPLPAEVRSGLPRLAGIHVATAIGELFVTQPVDNRHAAGSTVHVVLSPERLALFRSGPARAAAPPAASAGNVLERRQNPSPREILLVEHTHQSRPLGVRALRETVAPRPAPGSAACPQRRIIHVRWSGEGCWIPLGALDRMRTTPAFLRRATSSSIPAASARPDPACRRRTLCQQGRPACRQPLSHHHERS